MVEGIEFYRFIDIRDQVKYPNILLGRGLVLKLIKMVSASNYLPISEAGDN